jgi:hypothetical protein
MSDMFAAQAKKSMVKPTKEELKATEEVFDFTHLAEDIDPEQFLPKLDAMDDDFDLDSLPIPAIRHLHLKDPLILQPQPVDGWMIGKVTVEEDSIDDDFIPPPSPIRH